MAHGQKPEVPILEEMEKNKQKITGKVEDLKDFHQQWNT